MLGKIREILDDIMKDGQKIEHASDKLLQKSHDIAEKAGVELKVGRIIQNQIHRSNLSSETATEY